jgi:hypothetical protein
MLICSLSSNTAAEFQTKNEFNRKYQEINFVEEMGGRVQLENQSKSRNVTCA